MRWLLQWSFGCRHANTSFPQTVPSRRRHPPVATRDGHPNVAAPPQPARRSTEHQRRGLGTPAGGGHQNVGDGGGHPNVGAAGGHRNVGAGSEHSNGGAAGEHSIVGPGSGDPNVGAKVTYVTCLRCGREFNYCWRTMQRLSSAPPWAPNSAPTWVPTWIEEQMTGNCSSRALREIEELRHLWMT